MLRKAGKATLVRYESPARVDVGEVVLAGPMAALGQAVTVACRLVIADDTPDIRMLLRWSLDPDDRFDVVGEAANGAEAIDLIVAEKADAVLLDLAMPVMDGLQAIPEIKKRSPETKIVVLSGFDERTMSGEALSRGADAYLEKGVGFAKIAEVLEDVCGS